MSATEQPCFKRVTHCIFDNDGTVMDTESIYTTAIQNVLTPYGKTYTYEMKKRMTGLAAMVASVAMVREYNLPISPEQYLARFRAELHWLISDVKLKPGAKDLLLHLFEYRVPMAMATSGYRDTFCLKARPHCDLMPVFHHIVCGDDPELKESKPHPDIFLLAASRFKPAPPPECCLVFEDSTQGKDAGVAAGMQVVMIPDERLPLEETKGATLVLKSMADFQPELFGLPAYDYAEKFTFG
ncbi:PREDICTED: probable pseudouridine-5'-phosphatase [Drosophila arizonae]|uniref:Probable pseudouridine-5'-phosphatase n=1 Tax=Drosophila arizonae TaxID=7263 RepID=A0ABM1NZA9_DROAR|nr:PREDICTED: probable pseudouridine-5'-phosphatase [Drosophila arizonae]